MKLSLLLFGLACFATEHVLRQNDKLQRTNSILLEALEKLTSIDHDMSTDSTHWLLQKKFFEQDSASVNKPDVDPDEDLGPAGHCMDLSSLPISYHDIDEKYPCLRPYCESIKTAEECRSDKNFHHGCSWCAGSCQPYLSYNDAFITCVRDAYETHEPGKVNGKVPPGNPAISQYDMEWTNVQYGTPQQASHWFYGRMRWSDNENKRIKGDRVPIHVHPFPGLSCITTYDAEPSIIWAEGEEDFLLPSGTCYSMPPMKKLGPQSPGGYTVKDTFVYDTCYPLWVVIEPEHTDVQDNQFVFESDLKCCGTEICEKDKREN